KKMALRVLVFPVLASGGINFVAPGQIVTKLVFVLAVLMIPAAELVASRIKPDFAAMDEMERDMTPATTAPRPQRRPKAADRGIGAGRLHPRANVATIARMAGVKLATAQRILATVPTSPIPADIAQ